MKTAIKKSIIRIPADTIVVYCMLRKILIIKGPLNQKSVKLKLKISISRTSSVVKVSALSCFQISNKEKKKLKTLRGTTVALIKHKLIETSVIIQKNLKLHGVGYRVVFHEKLRNKELLTLKLGYSHPIYFKVPLKSEIFCLNKTKLCIFGDSLQYIHQISAKIRLYKQPEPYKGKGVLYVNEKITLKEGKKV